MMRGEGFSKTDLMYEILYNWEFVPRPSPRVHVWTEVIDGKPKYFLKNHIMETLYDLDKLSYDIWCLLDGKRSMADIVEITQKTMPNVQLLTILQTILFYAESGALQAVLEPVKTKRVRVESGLKVYITIVEHSKEFLGDIHRAVKPFLRRTLLWVSFAFVAVCGLAFASQFVHILGDKSHFEIFGSSVVGLFVYNFIILGPVTAVHEIAHGLAVVHYGGTPKDMGTGWFYFGPMFYCDATDAWTFSRRKRIIVMLAGNLSTMLIGSVIVVVLYFGSFTPPINHVLSMTAFWCFYTSLWNFAPPFETDGYYVLSNLLSMPTLRHDAYAYLKAVIKRSLKKPVKESAEFTPKKKKILLGYAVLSVVWLTYMAYQSFTLMTYMARDAAFSMFSIASAVLFSQALTIAAWAVSVASIVYFGIMISGYLFIFATALKKAMVGALRFEAIHDRDLSVFLCLPTQVPESMVNDLKAKMEKVAKKFTLNFEIERTGPLCIAVLRMSGKELALVQLKEHLHTIEMEFTSMYQRFLQRHKEDILRSAGIYAPQKSTLTNLLIEMGKEIAKTGSSEAKAVVQQIVKDQTRATFYLLNSVSGRVWTIELPPAQLFEVQKEVLSNLTVEDFSITDLYDEVEDFKKRIIYGYDSLSKLAVESQEGLSKALSYPEEYQMVAFLQPVRGRLVFVGRTERIEENIAAFGSLFVDQAWCSYMDALLSETSHMLSALGRTTFPDANEIQAMSDAELFVLQKNISTLIPNEEFIRESLDKCEKHLQSAMHNIGELKESLQKLGGFKVGLVEPIFALNAENLKSLPKRLKNFKDVFQKRNVEIQKMKGLVDGESQKRKGVSAGKKRTILRAWPLPLVLSAVLVLASIQFWMNPIGILLSAAAALTQLVYWTIYLYTWRSSHKLSRYPSGAFNQIQIFTFALTQALYKFVITSDILSSTKVKIKKEFQKAQRS